jgi:2-keto-4-pentenoate hydratase
MTAFMNSREPPAQCRALANRLIADHRDGKRFVPIALAFGIGDISAAYAVQREYVRLQLSQSGARAAGHKIGLTSKQMQSMCGLDSPVRGVIASDRVLSSPATLDGSGFGRLGLEFELAVRMREDLPAANNPFALDEVCAAVDAVCAAVELVDDRSCDYGTLDALSLIADNSWNAGVVHGEFQHAWPDLGAVEGVVRANGVEIGRGYGRDVLGHPFAALAWLAGQLTETGEFLRAGDLVMTGSIVRTQFPAVPTLYEFEVRGLGQVSCQVNFADAARVSTPAPSP